MTESTIKNHAAFIWSVADLLRGDYKQSEYGKVILPLTVLRRLDCVLESTKSAVERLDLGTEVELTHLRSEIIFKGPLALTVDTAEVKTVSGDGAGRRNDPDVEPLSQIVQTLNEQFGLNLDERDQLLFDQFEETWVADPKVTAQARNNTLDNFRLVFDRMFLSTVVSRMDDNEAIFKRILDDPEFQAALVDLYATRVYRRARKAG